MLQRLTQQQVVTVALAGALVLMTLVAYLPALQCGFIWDDDKYVTENQTLRTVEGLRLIWFKLGAVPQYYPLVHTTFWIEYHLWGLRPLGYHLTNILLHAAAVVLLWRLLVQLELPGAYFAAAVFALHPVHVESVAWITERKNTLSAVFYLLAAHLYLKFALDNQSRSDQSQRRLYVASLVSYVCALLSKTVTVTLPAALLLVIWWKRGRVSRRDFLPLLLMFAIAIPMGLITIWMERHRVGAMGAAWDYSLVERCLIAGRALWFYAGKLLCPYPLTFIYPRWQIDAAVWWQYLFPLTIVALIVALWRLRKRFGSGPLVAVLFFAGTLSPALGFFNVYPMKFSFVADHFQYLASIGLIALSVGAFWNWLMTVQQNRLFIAYAVLTPVLLVLVLLTWKQCLVYQNVESLWTDTWTKNPNSPMVLNNLGAVYARQGDDRRAMQFYQEALDADPDSVDPLNNMALLFEHQNRLSEALMFYERALAQPPDPSHVTTHIRYGNILLKLGRADEAMEHFRDTLRIDPRVVLAHMNLAGLLAGKGQVEEAKQHYLDAIRFDPSYDIAYVQLGSLYQQTGLLREALANYRKAIAINPQNGDAHTNLGYLFVGSNRDLALQHFQAAAKADNADAHYELSILVQDNEAALQHLNETLRINPNHPLANINLANLLWEKGQLADAIQHYQRAVKSAPDYPPARYNLALALQAHGNTEEAIGQLREAIKLRPEFPEAKRVLDRLLGVPEPNGGESADSSDSASP